MRHPVRVLSLDKDDVDDMLTRDFSLLLFCCLWSAGRGA